MFYENYLKLCEEHGEKPYQLVLKLGAKKNTVVAQWAKGSTPRAPMLNAIANYFGVSVGYLLTGETDEKTPVPTTENGLNAEQKELMGLYDSLGPADRAALVATARALAEARKSQGNP